MIDPHGRTYILRHNFINQRAQHEFMHGLGRN